MIPGGCDEQYSCSADIQPFVPVNHIAFYFVQHVPMPRGTASKAPSPFHIVPSRTHIHRRQISLEEVVGKELGAPYTCKFIPETGQIVLTPEKESTSPGSATEPTLLDKTVCAVWRFRSLTFPFSLAPSEFTVPRVHVFGASRATFSIGWRRVRATTAGDLPAAAFTESLIPYLAHIQTRITPCNPQSEMRRAGEMCR